MKVNACKPHAIHNTALYLGMLWTCFGQNEDRCGQQQVENMVRQHVPSVGWPHCWGHHKQRRSMKVDAVLNTFHSTDWYLRMLATCSDQNEDRCGQQQVESVVRHHVPSLGLPHCWGNHKQKRGMKVNELISS